MTIISLRGGKLICNKMQAKMCQWNSHKKLKRPNWKFAGEVASITTEILCMLQVVAHWFVISVKLPSWVPQNGWLVMIAFGQMMLIDEAEVSKQFVGFKWVKSNRNTSANASTKSLAGKCFHRLNMMKNDKNDKNMITHRWSLITSVDRWQVMWHTKVSPESV